MAGGAVVSQVVSQVVGGSCWHEAYSGPTRPSWSVELLSGTWHCPSRHTPTTAASQPAAPGGASISWLYWSLALGHIEAASLLLTFLRSVQP